jgi:hypothetical protein
MLFKTDFIYIDRKTKARYVYLKYESILKRRILDVGADECYLKQYLGEGNSYLGIGLDGNLDQLVDLEKGLIPFDSDTFDCVLCLDVLEHIDNIHDVFDELCRISKKYVIISLPNPHSVFWSYLKHGNYNEHQHLKFYGLPAEKPNDRHKWFFSTEEAENFVRYRANKNNMKIIQIDIEGNTPNKINFFKKIFLKILLRKNYNLYFDLISNKNLYSGTLWAVLKKEAS